ncbi:hypothetical protein ACTXGQ_07830 [Marinobacter sp. 1Y8]
MMNLLAIITVLVLALVVLVPFMEKRAKKNETQGESRDYGNITRFLFPLMGLLIVLQLIRYYFF